MLFSIEASISVNLDILYIVYEYCEGKNKSNGIFKSNA